MSTVRRFLARIAAFFQGRKLDADLHEELTAHIELAVEDNLKQGMSLEEARRRAFVSLGGREVAKELHRDCRGLPALEAMLQDLRYMFRTMRRDKGLTIFAILIMGLGIGASTIVFSVVDALLLRPLPFDDPGRLVWIQNYLGPTGSHKTIQVNYLLDLRKRTRVFADVAGYYGFKREGDQRLAGAGEPERLTGLAVTERFFPLLGVEPVVGRFFTAGECRWNAPKVVLISHGLWQRRFGADRGVVGRPLTINDEAVTVVGVLPATFDFGTIFEPGSRVDLFRPFPLSPETNRRGNTLYLVGRLKPGAALAAATTEVTTFAERSNGDSARNPFVPKVSTLREHVSGEYRTAMLVLASAVGFVMLIVCANLSNLFLSRGATREKEIAVRAALGADRNRLIRQMLTEGLLVSCSGASLGLLLSVGGTRMLAHSDSITIPLRGLVRVDLVTIVFTASLAIATGVVFGLVPGLRMNCLSLAEPLNESSRGSSDGRRRSWTRSALIVCQVAFAFVLLSGAGLLTRSFLRVLDVDLGFQPRNTLALRVDPGSHYSDQVADLVFFDEVLRRARSIPGVEAAGLTDSPPLGHNRQWSVGAKGRIYERGEQPHAYLHLVSEGYLGAMGIPLVAGRGFSAHDDRSQSRVALVNETLARMLWPGEDPIGRSVMTGAPLAYEVVGVVRDVRHLALEQKSGPELYLPVRQMLDYSAMHLVVRGSRSSTDLATTVRTAIRPLNPSLPLTDMRVMQEVVDKSISPRRFIVTLLAGFAVFALVLASLGIYAVVSHSVNQREQEIGIRMALGASAGEMQKHILLDTLKLVTIGMTAGLAASLGFGQTVQGLLFQVPPSDPLTFAAAFFVLVVVAMLAGYFPARRASRLDPVEALRAE